jgi:hypothetical protein
MAQTQIRAQTTLLMKKNLLYAAVLILLLAAAWWITQKDDRSTLDPNETVFSVEDTARIDRIFIADKSGRSILAEKEPDGRWLVNDTYYARWEVIDYILGAFRQMEVRMPVPKAGVENVKKQLSVTGKKVELYSKGKKVQVVYVGHATIDSRGTYMIKEGAETPFIIHIPGWEGYLSPRFFTNLQDWREQVIIKLHPDSIASVATEFPNAPAESYLLSINPDKTFTLLDGSGKTQAMVNEAFAKSLFAGFNKVQVESFDNHGVMRDSIVNMAPSWLNLKVTEKNGKTHTFTTYFKSQLNQLDVVLLDVMPDLDRDYLFYKEGNEFAVIQKRAMPWYYVTLSQLKSKD